MFARRPASYKAYGSSKEDNPPCDYPGFESTDMELVRHVSFVDCPGKHCIFCVIVSIALRIFNSRLWIHAQS